MVKRKRLGIKFDISYTAATGAAIYFLNIINALRVLPDERKPELYIFVSPDAPIEDINATNYPYIHVIPLKYPSKWMRAINRMYRSVIKGKRFNLLNAKTYSGEPLEGILNLVVPSEGINTKKQLIWMADLQVYHNPENYTKQELKGVKENKYRAMKAGYDIVLSSQWCVDDFNHIFPGHSCTIKRLRFAPTHPDFSHIHFEELKVKYAITHPYFIVSNQYWIHKNHLAVLKAINHLKKEFPDILCLFTGYPKVKSGKSKGYVEGLLSYIKENNLDRHIKFLGLIPREEQLCLLKNSIAIIQPSFFESWNTTVEDAKSLNSFIILSDLVVHREQIHENVAFFDPAKVEELIKGMEDVLHQPPVIVPHDYTENIRQFAEDILMIYE